MASFLNDGLDPLVRSRPRTEIAPDLHAVARLVHDEFDAQIGVRIVDECLDQVVARFAGATIRSFIPVLVHRYVREELRARNRIEPKAAAPLRQPPEPGQPLSA